MTFSKGFLLIFFSLSTLLNAGCFKAKNSAAEGAGMFYVEKFSGSSSVINSVPDWDLPNAQLYTFNACMRDTHSQETIKGHKFQILDNAGHIVAKDIRSDGEGCAHWNEQVNFNPVADPKYIPYTRFIKADGILSGQKKLFYALNPWTANPNLKNWANVVDLTKQTIDPSQIVDESQAKIYLMGEKKINSPKRNLWIDGMIISLSSQGPTDVFNNATLKLDIEPKIVVANMLGEPEVIPLYRGMFTAKAYMVSVIKTGDKVRRIRLGTAMHMDPQPMLGNRVRFDIPLSLSYGASMGQLEIAVELSPYNAPADIGSFEGTFLAGTFDIKQGFIGNTIDGNKIKNEFAKWNKGFTVDEYLKTAEIPDPTNLPSGIYAIQPFEFSLLQFPWAQVVTTRETPTSRTVGITIQTVVRNPMANNQPVRNAKFTITLWDGNKLTDRPTNVDGILSWRDTLTYNTYEPPHYILKYVTLTHDGFTQVIPVRLNPWAMFGYALGYDVRTTDAQSEAEFELRTLNLVPTQTIMNKFILQINGPVVYRMDKDLNVYPYKPFLVNLAPKILNYSHPMNGLEPFNNPYRDGNYLLKVGVVTQLKDRKYIYTTKKIAKVRNGELREEVYLKFPDFRQMRVKNSIYFEILPLDYSKLTPFLIATKARSDLPPVIKDDGKFPAYHEFPKDPNYEQLFIKESEEVQKKIAELYPNLDDLIESHETANIEPRTFVANNFVPSYNKSEGDLRPTDDLDDRINRDPKILQELLSTGMEAFQNPGEVTRYFARMHFDSTKEIQVSDLEQMATKQKEEVEATSTQLSYTNNFVKNANAEYVVLTPPSENVIYNQYFPQSNYPEFHANNKVISKFNSMESFVSKANSLNGSNVYADQKAGKIFSKVEVTPQSLERLLPKIRNGQLVTGKSLDQDTATRFCNFWFNHLFKKYTPYAPFGDQTWPLFLKCMADVESGRSIDEFFVLDQKLRVKSFEQLGDLRKGYYSRIGLNAGFDVSFGHSKNRAESGSITFSVGDLLTSAVRGLKYFLGGFIGFGFTPESVSESYSTSDGKSSGLGHSTSLMGEHGLVYARLDSYERCAIVRLAPNYIVDLQLVQKFQFQGSTEDKADILKRGVMFCTGRLEKDPVTVEEYVHYYAPDPSNGAVLEETDPRNYPWVVNFRGKRDFNQFINFLMLDGIKQSKISTSTDFGNLRHAISDAHPIDANQDPVNFINTAVDEFNNPRARGGVMTTYPGVYTVP